VPLETQYADSLLGFLMWTVRSNSGGMAFGDALLLPDAAPAVMAAE
jgi:hypothetical protein